MPSLWKHPQSQYFFACFTLPDGRRTKRSTKLTDRKKALKLAFDWEDAAHRQLTKDQARRVISDIYASINADRLESATCKDFLARWLEQKKREASPSTFTKYEGVVGQFLESLATKQETDLTNLDKADFVKFRDGLAKRLSASTANVALKIIRSAMQQAYCDSLIDTNPATKVKILKKRDGVERRAFTLPELKRLLDEADDEWKGMIMVGLYTGLRLSDVVRLTWQNVDLVRGEVFLVTKKTSRRQSLPLAKPLQTHLEAIGSSDNPTAPLFPRAYGTVMRGKDQSANVLSNQFYDLMASVGLVPARTHEKKKAGQGRGARRKINEVGFHALRHTATSLLKNAGVSDVVARDIIGHESAAVSRQYTHIDADTKRKALDAMPDLSSEG